MHESGTTPDRAIERARRLKELTHTLPREPQHLTRPTESYINQASIESPPVGEFSTSFASPPRILSDAPPPQIGTFKILSVIDEGGMGIVFKGHHSKLNRTAAVKMILGNADANSLQRFNVEAEALARLEHPNIVPVYEIGEWEGLAYFAMKYVPGGTLRDAAPRLRRNLPAMVRVLAKVARAVAHAHEQGVLHRDIKPANILMGENDEPLVADFGLAKFHGSDSSLTMTGALIGTRSYMPPEATRGNQHAVTTAGDVWSLGVVMYECISGKLPFVPTDEMDLFRQIRISEQPMLATESGDPLPELDRIIRRCLKKNPAARYATAAELAEDLERWLAGGQAAPAPLADAATPRRRKRTMAIAAVVLAALLIGLAALPPRRGDPPPQSQVRTLLGPTADSLSLSNVDLMTKDGLTLGRDESGRLTMETKTVGIIQLAEQSYPTGMRLKANVRQIATDQFRAFAGVYFMGRRVPDPRGPIFNMFALAMNTLTNGDPHPADPGSVEMMLVRWRPEQEKKPVAPAGYGVFPIGAPLETEPLKKERGGGPKTITMQLDLHPDGSVHPVVNDLWQMKPAAPQRIALQMMLMSRRDEPHLRDEQFGNGVGLFVEGCKAAFWNVTVEPLPPAGKP